MGGKYMKKSKITAELSLLEAAFSRRSSAGLSGVLTRAKTLSLRHATRNLPPSSSSFCYLELRSRRLRRKPPIKPRNQTPRTRRGSSGLHSSSSVGDGSSLASSRPVTVIESASASGSVSMSCEESTCGVDFRDNIEMGGSDDSDRGQNNSESDEHSERTQRLVNNDDNVVPAIPMTQEMEEFFALAEQEQRKLFIEKYNFDVLTDTPLPGRFEWVRVWP